MASIEIKRLFPGKQSDECYRACLRMVEKAGYQVFKKREIASLVICNGTVGGMPVSLNAIVPFGFPTAITLSISGEEVGEDRLNAEAERLFAMLEAELKR